MGHCVDYLVVKKRSEILPAAKLFAAENVDRQENISGSYHGNMTIHDSPICNDRREARQKLDAWGSVGYYSDHAVQFRNTDQAKPTKAIDALQKRIAKNRADKEKYEETHSVTNQKAKLISCPNCESRLARVYLRHDFCPVCNADLRSGYIQERIRKYDTDFQKLRKDLEEEKKKQKDKVPVEWLVKVEVHC